MAATGNYKSYGATQISAEMRARRASCCALNLPVTSNQVPFGISANTLDKLEILKFFCKI